MNPQDNNTPGGGASLPLPDEPAAASPMHNRDAAAELIRKKVEAAYNAEPDAATAALDTAELPPNTNLSKHQKFINDLTNSGKTLPEIQTAWHEYYMALPDEQKHQVWQEFYGTHSQVVSSVSPPQPLAPEPEQKPQHNPAKTKAKKRSYGEIKESVLPRKSKKLKPRQHFQSLLFGLGVGSVVMLIFLFGFFNERFIAPFIQPSRTVSNTPIISSGSASGKEPEILIPKINLEVPVVYGVDSIQESAVQKALEGGVVHYADTAEPGQNGNMVIVGHSSNNIFNNGKYKFAFVLLGKLEEKDIFYLEKDGKRYTYEVFEKKVVKPTDVSVLGATDKPATVTLITCDPPGTSTNRMVVVGQQIDPDPSANTTEVAQNKLATSSAVVPGNSQSLWSRMFSWLSR